jgi:neuropeptide Y receptor
METFSSLVNQTGSSNSSDSPMYHSDVPLYLQVLASICYIISMILSIGGNILVLLVIFGHQRMKTVTSIFIINLAISDLIFALLCIPSTYVTAYLIQYWPFSAFACVFFNYMQTVSVTLTVYTLIWITFDKYWAFVRPLKLRMSIKVSKYLILVSWLFSLFVSLPIAFFTKLTYSSSPVGTNETIEYASNPQCIEAWPEQLINIHQIYNFSLLLIQYFIPLAVLAYYYLRIYIVLTKAQVPGESIEQRDAKIIKSKKKVINFSAKIVTLCSKSQNKEILY